MSDKQGEMVHERSVCMGFVRGNARGRCLGNEPLTLTRCHSLMKPLKGEIRLWPRPQLQNIKGKISFFSYLLALLIFYFRSLHGMMRADPAVAGTG